LKNGPALFQRGAFGFCFESMTCRAAQRVKRYLTGALLLACLASTGRAQEDIKRPPLRVPETVDTALQLVPPGWRAETGTLNEVDLNGDGKPDAVLVISHGSFDATGPGETTIVKHVLVLALRGEDGKLHRSMVNDGAVLDGDEGGVFGDPFESLSVEHGAVVIMHYGGSRDRWGYTHRYRYQDRQWMLIGLDFGNTDLLDLEHYDNHDIDLSTGLVGASEKGNYEGQPKKPELEGAYYELQVLRVEQRPVIDGRAAPNEWPGYTVQLDQRQQVYRRRQVWRGPNDLAAKLQAVEVEGDLYLCATVTDNEVTAGDAVRLVTRKGIVIKPRESRRSSTGHGYVFEARYSLKDFGAALKRDKSFVFDEEEVDNVFSSAEDARNIEGLELPVSVEVVDADRSRIPKARSVMSTRLAGSPYSGAIRIYRKGTLVLVSDKEQ
jgi:hypothetical protein